MQPEIRLYYAPIGEMSKPKIDWKPFCTISDSLVRGFDIHGNKAYAITSKGAPSYRLISTSVDHPDWTHAETILPEQKDVMQYFVKGGDYLLAVYSNGITGRVVAYHFDDGKMSQLSLPMSGTVEVELPRQVHERIPRNYNLMDPARNVVQLRCGQTNIHKEHF